MAKTKEQREKEAMEKALAKEARRKANIIAPVEEIKAEPQLVETIEPTEVVETVAPSDKIKSTQVLKNGEIILNDEESATKSSEKRNTTKRKQKVAENSQDENDKEDDKSLAEFPKPNNPVPQENKPYMAEFVYTLQDIIDVTKKFNQGEITIEEMNKFGQTFIIRDYLPLMDKMSIIAAIMTQHLYSTSHIQEVRLAELYRNLFFYGLLQGYALVDCRDRELINYENYDLLYPVFAPFIKSYCGEDWKFFMEYIRDSINIYGVINITDTVNGIDMSGLQKATEENKKLINELQTNNELIKNLNELAQMTDPMTRKIRDELKKLGVANAKLQAKREVEEALQQKDENTMVDTVKEVIEKDKEQLQKERDEIKASINQDEIDEDDDFEF